MQKVIKVGIIGLGLIGASLLKALYKKNYEIFCVSKSSYKKAKKYTKNSSNSIETVKNCDIIFVCTSISKTIDTLNELNQFLDKKTIVCDVASIKNKLLHKKFNFNFILTHPMAGTEKSGFNASFEELFYNAKWLIEKENTLLKKIVKDTGAKAIKINMKNHDKLVAQISHLPTILSFILFDSVNDNAKLIASSGFRDTTRLAITNSELALSMYNDNEKNILNSFDKLIKKFDCLKKMSDNEKIKLFEKISKKRAGMYNKDGKNIFSI